MKPLIVLTLIITHLTLCLPLHGMKEGTKMRRNDTLPHLGSLAPNQLATSPRKLPRQAKVTPPAPTNPSNDSNNKSDNYLEQLERQLVAHFLTQYADDADNVSSRKVRLTPDEKTHIKIKIKELVNKKLLDDISHNGTTFLHYAAGCADHSLVAVLLTCGADKKIPCPANNNLPALVIAQVKQARHVNLPQKYNDYQQCIDLLAEPEPEGNDDSSL